MDLNALYEQIFTFQNIGHIGTVNGHIFWEIYSKLTLPLELLDVFAQVEK